MVTALEYWSSLVILAQIFWFSIMVYSLGFHILDVSIWKTHCTNPYIVIVAPIADIEASRNLVHPDDAYSRRLFRIKEWIYLFFVGKLSRRFDLFAILFFIVGSMVRYFIPRTNHATNNEGKKLVGTRDNIPFLEVFFDVRILAVALLYRFIIYPIHCYTKKSILFIHDTMYLCIIIRHRRLPIHKSCAYYNIRGWEKIIAT